MTRLSGFAPLLLAVAGSLLYHLSAKSIPKVVDPAAALMSVYATALGGSLITFAIFKSGPIVPAWSRLWHPTLAGVGLGALMIELGFLLAYRGTWPVSAASVVVNALAGILLIPLGAVVFGEAITIDRALGVLLCLIGVTLLQR